MATIGNTVPTLLDVAKRLNPDGGGIMPIAELLSQENEMLLDMPWYEGNLPTGSRITTRTGLPDVIYRKLNSGVPPSKSTTAQVDEACGILEGRGQVDKDLALLNGNTSAFRLSESKAFIEAMNQTQQRTSFYGNQDVTPEGFTGIAPRFNTVSTATAATAANVINAGGTGSTNTSIWLIGWGENTVHGIYPKGSQAGLVHNDLGEGDAFDENGNRFRAYMDQYQWKAGIAVKDWRYIVRIANIDVSTLTKNAASGADIIDLMTQALELIQGLTGVTPVFYVSRRIRSFLRRQTVNKVAASTLTYENVAGKPVLMFGEVPVRRVDAILNTEARVV
ncbi:major capsid protein [Pseudomonas aeruginosa]|uniref:major capsid protein n=1 Tax=Pseudomonas aeruginosa TaxID=287 RepID=UPI00366B17BF